MHEKITASQLKKTLKEEFDGLINEVVEAVNQAQPGRIIADSEEQVRQASALFRRRLYERALQLRQQHSEAAFSPCAQRRRAQVGE
jgi:riboflavin biosynthesis pyrimidine reductase